MISSEKPPFRLGLSVGLFTLLLTSVVLVRAFTETVKVLPHVFEYAYDLLLPMGVLAVLLPKVRRSRRFHFYGLMLFLGIFGSVWIFSCLVNRDVHFITALAFLAMHMEGPLWFLILANLPWEPGDLENCARIFAGFAALEVLLCLMQIPYGLYVGNPDVVSGTFGQNNSQLAFFLALFTFYLLARYAFGRISLVRLVLFLLGTIIVFFAAGFRSIWVSYFLTSALLVMVSGKLSRRQVTGVVITLAIVSSLAVATVGQAVERFADVFQVDLSQVGKIEAAASVWSLYKEHSIFAAVGCGPGTFSSRAWSTFTRIGEFGAIDFTVFDDANWGSGPSSGLALYRPGYYSAEYIMPIYRKPVALLGSITIDGPFTSYVSLFAEVGIIGACALLGGYLFTVFHLWRAFKAHANVTAAILSLAAIGGFVLLFQMSVFDNWLEVGRVTIPVWALAALPLAWSRGQISREVSPAVPDPELGAQ
jgi:hypothetical protein